MFPVLGGGYPTKNSEYKDDTIFKNRMGGSDENCIPNRR